MPPGAPAVGIAASADGKGYFIAAGRRLGLRLRRRRLPRLSGRQVDQRRRRRDGGRPGDRRLLARDLQGRGLWRGRPELRLSFDAHAVADRRHRRRTRRDGLLVGGAGRARLLLRTALHSPTADGISDRRSSAIAASRSAKVLAGDVRRDDVRVGKAGCSRPGASRRPFEPRSWPSARPSRNGPREYEYGTGNVDSGPAHIHLPAT